jgi:hypothetical protein
MKCSFCTYDQKPDSLFLLKAHAEEDILEGKTRGVIPVAVWRDGEFLIVEEAKDDERVYEIGIIDPRPVEEVDLGFKPLPDEEEPEKLYESKVKVVDKKPTNLL